MKTISTAIYSLVFLTLTCQANAWSQVQWAGGPYYPQSQVPEPASYCDDCGDVTGGCACDDSGHSGLLSGLGSHGALGCLGECSGWFDVEYLLWWGKERYIPALVTTSPLGTPETLAGRLGQPTTSILFGNDLIGDDPESGFRISGGKWLDERQTIGVGGRFFTLENEDGFFQSSNGDTILARPFFNTLSNSQDALLVAYPGITNGNINISAENEVQGYDVFLRKLLLSGYCNRWDVIGGYHGSRIKDSVDIRNSLVSVSGGLNRLPIDSTVDTQDYFEVRNQFDGGFVGIMASAEDGRLSWSLLGKIAFGNMNQKARISGSTRTAVPGAGSATNNFGLLALPTNIGSFDVDEFAMVPELNVSVGYNVTNNFQLKLGYSFIYWTEVALAGDMIDLTINPTQLTGNLVGPARPSASLTSDGFWYTGLNLGGTLRF